MHPLLLVLQLIGMMTSFILAFVALTALLRILADFTADLNKHLRTAHRKLRRVQTKAVITTRRFFRPKKPKPSRRPHYKPPPQPQSHKQSQQNAQHVKEHLRQTRAYDLQDNIGRWERELSAELYLELARAQDDWARY